MRYATQRVAFFDGIDYSILSTMWRELISRCIINKIIVLLNKMKDISMDFWVYIVKCADNSYYTGHTDNLEQRIAQHQQKYFPGCYTATRLPITLVFSQPFPTRAEALAAEQQIKGWSRKKKEAMMRGDWQEVSRLAKAHMPISPVHAEPVDFVRGEPADFVRGEPVEFVHGEPVEPHPSSSSGRTELGDPSILPLALSEVEGTARTETETETGTSFSKGAT